MRRLLTPTVQISLGLLSLMLSLILIAYSIGLVPNEDKAALEVRARISENLAIQLASLAGRDDAAAIKDTIASVLSRNNDVLSIAIRGADGKMLVASENHASQWVEPVDGKSTATQIQIPLLNADAPGGKIEIAFRPLPTFTNLLGLSRAMVGFICFIAGAGFPGFYFVLSRALRELDPSRAIPERVKAAFDTLAEGVLIMDEQEFIVLANDAFVKNIYDGGALLGTNVNELPWVQPESGSIAAEFPWQAALHHADPVLDKPISLCRRSGGRRRLLVNSTRIVDGKGIVRGLIATFDDVTVLHQTNEQLNLSIDRLNLSQRKISEQNQQLKILASSDPLTGCLNRRSFFAEAESTLQIARSQGQPLSLLMLDVDHFKSINDRFGHVVGDEVLIGLVDVLKRTCRGSDLVGRYGGEEFCIVVVGLVEKDVERLAERIRLAVADVTTWLPNGERITISAGVASLGGQRRVVADLVRRADEALYAAKTAGRNRVVNWDSLTVRTEAPGSGSLGQPPRIRDSAASLVPDQSGADWADLDDSSIVDRRPR
jgi:diguanylate cyclase (GGDEF)-like protein/PAS domain S-box-containing protein